MLEALVGESNTIFSGVQIAHVELARALADRDVGELHTVLRDRGPLFGDAIGREASFRAVLLAHPQRRCAESSADEDDASVASDDGLSLRKRRCRQPLRLRTARDGDAPKIEVALT